MSTVMNRYKLKDDVRESMYDACREWTSALKKSGRKFMGGDQPDLADLVSRSSGFEKFHLLHGRL